MKEFPNRIINQKGMKLFVAKIIFAQRQLLKRKKWKNYKSVPEIWHTVP